MFHVARARTDEGIEIKDNTLSPGAGGARVDDASEMRKHVH